MVEGLVVPGSGVSVRGVDLPPLNRRGSGSLPLGGAQSGQQHQATAKW